MSVLVEGIVIIWNLPRSPVVNNENSPPLHPLGKSAKLIPSARVCLCEYYVQTMGIVGLNHSNNPVGDACIYEINGGLGKGWRWPRDDMDMTTIWTTTRGRFLRIRH